MDELWVDCEKGEIPPLPVEAGIDSDGDIMYVGRCEYIDELLPAKIIPNKQHAYICYRGQITELRYYEGLTGINYIWIPASYGDVPTTAVRVGKSCAGETLFAGRSIYKGSLIMGEVHPSYGGLYITCDNEEIHLTKYEVLSLPDLWISATPDTMPDNAFVAGTDSEDDHIYVGLVYIDDELTPAEVIPTKGAAFVWCFDQYHKLQTFQVLVGYSYKWIPFRNIDNIDARPVPGGYTFDGETLYIGRALIEDTVCVGKIHPVTGFMDGHFIAGVKGKAFDILVRK